MIRSRDEKLSPAVQLLDDLSNLRDKLVAFGLAHSGATRWVVGSIDDIGSQLHDRIWPPIWWRYGRIDAQASWLAHSFHRGDSEGIFYAQSESGYVPQREEILALMDSIYKSYKAARR